MILFKHIFVLKAINNDFVYFILSLFYIANIEDTRP